MADRSREGQFKIEQRIGEPVDLTLIRCFVKALPHMSRQAAQAATIWMLAKASDRKTVFGDPISPVSPGFERALNRFLKRRGLVIDSDR